MEFVIGISFIILFLVMIVRDSIRSKNIVKNEYLYDQETVRIMKNYKLINDDEYRLMIENLKKKEKWSIKTN